MMYVPIVHPGRSKPRRTDRASPTSDDACMSPVATQRDVKHMHLIVVAPWKGTENSHRDGGDDQCTSKSLQEDGVLDLPESRLLNPDFAIKDFTDDVAFLVFGDPGFVFVAVGAAKRVEGTFAHVHR